MKPLCACTWFWHFRNAAPRPEDHMEGICPLYAPPGTRPRCTCTLLDIADQVVDELHDDDCARHADLELDADEAIVLAHERRHG